MKNIVSFAVMALLGMTNAAPEEDRVRSLPDMNGGAEFDFKMYSGYVPIPETTKEIHYLFLEAQYTPKFAPLMVWYNGGPGCSSMLAFMQEHGPFELADGDYSFTANPYSWNREANMLYIEQPAGVGYSFGDCEAKPDQCNYDDNLMARENLASLLQWYAKFPEYQTNDLYLAGESYGGIYVPYTLNEIHHHNAVHARNPGQFKPNLKGMMVGNGCTNWEYDTDQAYHEMGFYHSLYPGSVWRQMLALKCDYSGNEFGLSVSKECGALEDIFNRATQNINIYDVTGYCYPPNASSPKAGEKGVAMVGGEQKVYNKVATPQDYTPWVFKNRKLGEVPPCIFGAPVIEYLNREDVRQALNIPNKVQAWDLCQGGNLVHWTYEPLRRGSQWIWEGLKGQYRMLKFSGDVDGAVPTTGSRGWINSLNRTILQPWREYYVTGANVPAGSIIEYDGLTFATVHGAGHMAPQFKPAQTYHLIFNWLRQSPI